MKKKNYLKFGILLFGISIFLVNCEQDNIVKETNSKYSIKSITHNQVIQNQKIATKIANYRTLIEKEETSDYQARLLHSDDYNFTIDTDKVMYLENNETGYNSYNFYLIRDNPIDDKLENLVLTLNDNGEYDTYIIKYGFSLAEYETLSEDEIMLLETSITPIDFDTSIFYDSELSQKVMFESTDDNGLIWGYDCQEVLVNINCSECEPWYVWQLENCHWVLLGSTGGGGGMDTSGDSNNSNSGSTSSSNNNGPVPHGGSSTNNISPIVSSPSLPVFSTPCNNLSNIINNSITKTQINQLRTYSNDSNIDNEKGFKIQKNPANSTFQPAPIQSGADSDNGNRIINIIPTSYTIAIFHTHPQEDVYGMFSAQDILCLARMANTISLTTSSNNINPINLTLFIVYYGQVFALNFDDIESIQNLQNIYNDNGKRKKFIGKLLSDYESDNNFILGETSNIDDQQKRLYQFFDKYNLNMSIYKATFTNNQIDEWLRVKPDATTEPCN